MRRRHIKGMGRVAKQMSVNMFQPMILQSASRNGCCAPDRGGLGEQTCTDKGEDAEDFYRPASRCLQQCLVPVRRNGITIGQNRDPALDHVRQMKAGNALDQQLVLGFAVRLSISATRVISREMPARKGRSLTHQAPDYPRPPHVQWVAQPELRERHRKLEHT